MNNKIIKQIKEELINKINNLDYPEVDFKVTKIKSDLGTLENCIYARGNEKYI